MTVEEVIENELKCVQRDCCRLENECAKCDLVLPKEEIINAYNNALRLEKENAELKEVHESDKRSLALIAKKGADLEREISVLLSCKNCPENKGGYICQKEYEDKCLAQKIQYIKELQEENKKWKDEWQEQVQKENNESYARTLQTIQLNKAKKIISNLYAICKDNHYPNTSVLMEQAEQFLKEE